MTGKKCKIEGCIAPYEGGSDHQRVYHTGVKWNSVNIQHDNPNDPCSPFICPLCPQGELVHSRYNSYALSKIMSQHHDPEVGERYPDPHLMPKLLGRKRKPGNKRKVVNPSPDTQANTPPDTGDSAIGNEANPTNPDPEPDVPEDLETKNKQPERKSKAGDKRRVVNPSPDAQVSIALDAADSAIGDQVNSTSPDPEPKVPKDLGTKKKQPEDIEHLQARLERHMLVDNTGNMVAEDEEVGFDPSIEPKPTKGKGKRVSDQPRSDEGAKFERNPVLENKGKGKGQGIPFVERENPENAPHRMVHPSLSWDNKTDLYTCNKNKVCCDHEEAKCVLLECFNMFLIPSLKAIGLRCFSKRKQIFIQRVIGLDEIVGQWKDSGLFPKGLGSGDILKSGWGYTISAHIRHHTDDFHLENSDVKSFINKIDLVLPKPVEEFEVELARNIRCNRCGAFFALGAPIRAHYNQTCTSAVKDGFPQSMSTAASKNGSDLFPIKWVQVVGQSIKIPVHDPDKPSVAYDSFELLPKDMFVQQMCPKGFPESWFDWLANDVGLNFTRSPAIQKQEAGFSPKLIMFLVENPSLHLVTASQGEAKVREEICHESYLLIRRYLIDAGEKGKDIPKFSEMMQASSGITWRTFKDLDSYDLYRVSFTNLITTYLRWKTTDLQRKLPLNVPPEIEKAFLPLLRMIHRRRCGNVDELAPIIHNIFVKVILWEQSTEIKTPLLLEKVVALQSVELGGFRPIKRVSGLCSMMQRSIASSVLLSVTSGGWEEQYYLPGKEKLGDVENILEEGHGLLWDGESDSSDEEHVEISSSKPSGGNFKIAKEVPLKPAELDDLAKIPVDKSSLSKNPRELGDLLLKSIETALSKDHLVSTMSFAALAKAQKSLYLPSLNEPSPIRVEISQNSTIFKIWNVRQPKGKQFSRDKLEAAVQEVIKNVKSSFEAFMPPGALHKLRNEYKIEDIKDNAGDSQSLFLHKDNQIYFEKFSQALQDELNQLHIKYDGHFDPETLEEDGGSKNTSFNSRAAWSFLQMIDDFADALVVQLFYSTGVPPKASQVQELLFSTDQGLSRMLKKLQNGYFILCSPRDKRSALQEPSNQYRCVWGLPHEYVWYLTIFIWVIRPVQISVLQRLKLLAPRVSSLHSHIFVRLTKPLGHGFTYDGPLVNELLKESGLNIEARELKHIFLAISQIVCPQLASATTSTSVMNRQAQHTNKTGDTNYARNSYVEATGFMQTEVLQMMTLSYEVQKFIGATVEVPKGFSAVDVHDMFMRSYLPGLLEAHNYILSPVGYNLARDIQTPEGLNKWQDLEERKPYLFGQNYNPSGDDWELNWTELGDECLTTVAAALADNLEYDKARLVATSVYMIELALEKAKSISRAQEPLKIETDKNQVSFETHVVALARWFEDNHEAEWNKFWGKVDQSITDSSARKQAPLPFRQKHDFPSIPGSSKKT